MVLPKTITTQTLRIVDASLNRIGEGLRLLEDVARLTLNDATLNQQLKTMRHELITVSPALNQQLLQARNSEDDVGVNLSTPQQAKEKKLPEVVVANARRVQQSLRVIEELAKTPDIKLDSVKFKKARFNLYAIERDLLSKLLRKDKLERISGLHAIIDTKFLKRRSHLEVAAQLIRGGTEVIQLRDKTQGKSELLPIARQLKSLCSEHNVLFIVNDHLDLALAADADGLHLGQDDLPITAARRLLPPDKLLGCSVTTVKQATTAESEGADYIAAGAIYPTTSREATEVIGLEGLRLIKNEIALPLVAIGGIIVNNVAEVLAAGASSVAVISAIMQAESPKEAARQIVNKLKMQESVV
jgi:thiamine-phosphate pyrophosphorylase|tara:strand:+ start:278 stop:1351 length:1074 start_codon:yes stop_codon:yes gene_type:complete